MRAVYERALALSEAGDAAGAWEVLAQILQSGSPGFEVQALAGALHERLGRLDQALAIYERLAEHGAWHAGVRNALGRVHAMLGRPESALALFDEVLAREPQNADALFNRGNALRLLFRREETIEAYRAVLPLHADYANQALLDIGQQQQALLDFDSARISYLQHYITSGGSLEAIARRLSNEHYVWPPNPAGIAALAGELGSRYAAQVPLPVLPMPAVRPDGQRLRIGLVSPDLWSHPVGYFLEALLSASAAREADWFVYASRAPDDDALTARLRARAGTWREVLAWSDEQVAQQVRLDGIDVLVDLAGYSAGYRLDAFASRPAPLQLSWLGFHGTTGLPFVDGVIADWHCVRAGEEHFFTEEILRLPHTRFCYTPQPGAPAVAPAPVLRKGSITFGCFQQIIKIGPQVLAAWARIAAALPDARWVLAVASPDTTGSDHERFRRRCAEAGFTPAHMELRGQREIADYLAGYAEVDLALDTFPFTGGTTTAEALWMGVPTLTLSSPGMIGRQGEQIMRAAGMPEWVTQGVDEYVDKAIEAGRNAAQSAWTALRPTMRERLSGTPMFDAERFARHWIDAVQGFWRQKTSLVTPATGPAAARLLFYVPSYDHPFGGVKVIYEHVAALNRLGFRAYTYTPPGSRVGTFWTVARHELDAWQPTAADVVIAPEVMPAAWLRQTRASGCGLYLFVQNWANVWPSFAAGDGVLDGLLVISDSTEAIAQRCLPKLPRWRVPFAIAPVSGEALPRKAAIAYMPRKMPELAAFLRGAWPLAFPDLADVEWIELGGMPHAAVLQTLREVRYFVSLQSLEGLGLPALEAMAAGCLVVGFDGVGGREYARPDNGLWVPDQDGLALLDALGHAVRQERATPGALDALRRAGQQMAARYSAPARDAALLAAFQPMVAMAGRE